MERHDARLIRATVRGLTTEVSLGKRAGLVHGSVANLDNVFLLARRRLVRRLGRVDREAMERVCEALAVAVACASEHSA